jgi:hypothetical protein
MPQLKLKTRLHREDIKGAWTYLVVRDAFKVFGSKTNIPVKGTIDNHPIEGTLQPRGDGSHWFPVKKDFRDSIGKSIGEMVDVVFENAVLTHTEPDDLKKAISKSKKASAQWNNFTDSKKKYYITWIENAKQDATRKKRIKEALGRIEKGLNQYD